MKKQYRVPMAIYGYAQVNAESIDEALEEVRSMIYPQTWVEVNELGSHIDFKINDTETFDCEIEEEL